MNQNKTLMMLGLAQRAGKVKSGEFMTENSVKDYSACLVIVAEDASYNTKKQFGNMCEYYEVPYLEYGTKETLGHAIGKEFRASLSIVDQGLADKIMAVISENKESEGGAINGKN